MKFWMTVIVSLLAISLCALDIKDKNAKELLNCEIIEVFPDRIIVLHNTGWTQLNTSNLDNDILRPIKSISKTQIETFTDQNGSLYEDVTIAYVEVDGITVEHKRGTSFVRFKDLPEGLQNTSRRAALDGPIVAVVENPPTELPSLQKTEKEQAPERLREKEPEVSLKTETSPKKKAEENIQENNSAPSSKACKLEKYKKIHAGISEALSLYPELDLKYIDDKKLKKSLKYFKKKNKKYKSKISKYKKLIAKIKDILEKYNDNLEFRSIKDYSKQEKKLKKYSAALKENVEDKEKLFKENADRLKEYKALLKDKLAEYKEKIKSGF